MQLRTVSMGGQSSSNPMIRYFAAGICLLLFAAVSAPARSELNASSARKPSGDAARFHETSIGKIPGGSQLVDLQAAADQVAWVEHKPSTDKWLVRRNGEQQGAKYDGVKYLEFSSDGAHLAFFGQRGSKWVLVLDGQERSPEYVDVTPVVFQPHGTSWAYGACAMDQSCQLVVDGRATGEAYEQVSFPQYSLDGKRIAYLSETKEKWTPVVDGKPLGPPAEAYSYWGFSPNGAHFFVCGDVKKVGWTYVLDGHPGPGFSVVGPIAFSNDGKDYAYGASEVQYGFAKNKLSGTVVVDGKAGSSFQGGGLVGEWTVLLNAPIMAAEIYGNTGFISFFLLYPASGARVLAPRVYGVSDASFDGKGNVAYAARRGSKDVVVIDGDQAGPQFDDVVSDIVFTKDGLHSAYVALRGRDFVEVHNDQVTKVLSLDSPPVSDPLKSDEDSGANKPAPAPPDPNLFSVAWTRMTEDGNHFAYQVVHGGPSFRVGKTSHARRIVVLDGQPGKRYNADGISTLDFSDDAKHYWYTVSGADGKRSLVVVDGDESKLYNDLTEAHLDDTRKSVIFFGRSGARILRITCALR